ncbi:MAG: hypothetical protein K0R90_676 [Oscillospiraceae bacterium]|jgi:LPXTG-motif cell wall-anchored protein|nr:hypothetical protein [Oscillospiraceae bacterium]
MGQQHIFKCDTQNTGGDFVWFNVGIINVETVGKHKFSVWEREDGIVIDKLVLTKSAVSSSGTGGNVSRELSSIDKTELNSEIAEAEKYLDGNYTEQSLAVLRTAIENSKTIASNSNAVQSEIDNAIKDIEPAIENLKLKQDNSSTSPSSDKEQGTGTPNTGDKPFGVLFVITLIFVASVGVIILKKRKIN